MPAADATKPIAEAQTQLALFRAMRQARKHSVEFSSQLILAKQEAARQSALHQEQRAVWERDLSEAQQQFSVAQEQLISLGIRLRDYEVALQAKSDELQNTSLAFANARSTMQKLVEPTKHAQVVAELSATKQHLQHRVTEREQAVKVAMAATEALLAAKQKLAETEAQLAKKTAFIEEFSPKLKRLYARLLLIKEKQDWRL